MNYLEDESLEDYTERFKFVKQRGNLDLVEDVLETIFLKGMRAESMDTLNMMEYGDIYNLPFTQIFEFFVNYSHTRPPLQSNKVGGTTSRGVTCDELSNMLETMKTELLSTFTFSLDILQRNNDTTIEGVYCPCCKKNRVLHEYILDKICICSICEQGHPT